MNSSQFGQTLALPDSWQRKALNYLREGKDVVLHAPTGALQNLVSLSSLLNPVGKGNPFTPFRLELWQMISFVTGKKRMGCRTYNRRCKIPP